MLHNVEIFSDVFFQQFQQQISPTTTPDRTASPAIKAPTNDDLPMPSPTNVSGEQPLDLSAKPGGSSGDSKNIFKWVNYSINLNDSLNPLIVIWYNQVIEPSKIFSRININCSNSWLNKIQLSTTYYLLVYFLIIILSTWEKYLRLLKSA